MGLESLQFRITEEGEVESPKKPYRAGVLPRFSDKLVVEAVIQEGDRVIGDVIMFYDGRLAWSFRLRVDEDFRRKGVGSYLGDIREQYLKGKGVQEIHTYAGSPAGTAFTKKRGFEDYDGEMATAFNPIVLRL